MMQRRIAFIFILAAFLGCAPASYAQVITGGYEWTQPGQPYVKIVVNATGMYRVSGTQIINANVAFSGAAISNLHLYYRGVEVPIHVYANGNAAVLENIDFIEFFGEKNDGWHDKLLYRNSQSGIGDSSLIANVRRSLFTDESAYFLTFNSTPGLRFATSTTVPADYATRTPDPHFRHEAFFDVIEQYNAGSAVSSYDTEYLFNADYVAGEGYTSFPFSSTPYAFSFATPGAIPVATTAPQLICRVGGVNFTSHSVTVRLGTSSQVVSYSNIGIQSASFAVLQSAIGSATTPVTLTGSNGNDLNVFHWAALRYDRSYQFQGLRNVVLHQVALNSQPSVYLRLASLDFNVVSDSGFVFDITNSRRIRGVTRVTAAASVNDTLHAVLPGAAGNARMAAVVATNFLSPVRVVAASLSSLNLPSAGAEMVVITHPAMLNSANAYKQYRDTCSVNQKSTKVVLLNEVIDEFGFGSINPVAIKRFIRTALDRWTVKPKYVLIWGDALREPRFTYNATTSNNVPTYGYPPSDEQYVSNFNYSQNNIVPVVPIGRYSLANDAQGLDYVAKLNEYEHSPFEDWQKRAIHLAGGLNPDEQQIIASYFTSTYNPIFKAAPLAGTVFFHQKVSNSTIDNDIGPRIKSTVDTSGVVITFFGHSTSNILDIELAEGDQYSNFGRYPLVIANGCYGGDFTNFSFGERFVRTPGRGSIGYLGMSGEGSPPFLDQVTSKFYAYAFRDSMRSSLGHIIRATSRDLFNAAPTSAAARAHIQQFTLLGDPSIRLYQPSAPDLVVTASDVKFIPTTTIAQSDSFKLQLTLRNRGLATATPFDVRITQTTGTGRQLPSLILSQNSITGNSRVVTYTIQRNGIDFAGVNTFAIELDIGNSIGEILESNNSVTVIQDFVSDLPAPVYPWNSALLNRDTVSLVAASYGLTRAQVSVGYYFEIDSVVTFNSSAFRQSGLVNGNGVAGVWRVPFQLENGQVYYWRVRLAASQADRWVVRSFRYQSGTDVGWQQSKPQQMGDVATANLSYDSLARRWVYASQLVRFYGYQGINPWIPKSFFVNANVSASQAFNESFVSGIYYATFDGSTLQPLLPETVYGRVAYMTEPDAAANLPGIISNLRAGDFIVIFGTGALTANWTQPAYAPALAALSQIGVTNQVSMRPVGTRFIFFAQKGMSVGQASECYLQTPVTAPCFLEGNFLTSGFSGSLSSERIGPANAWGSFRWNANPVEVTVGDTARATLYAIRVNGTDSLVATNIASNAAAISLSTISAGLYPYMRVTSSLRDVITRTPPQHDYWQVTYSPVPDLVIDPFTAFRFDSTSVQEGRSVNFAATVRNLVSVPADSTWLTYTFQPRTGLGAQLARQRLAPIPAGGSLPVTFSFSTSGRAGIDSRFLARVNEVPNIPEQNNFNNTFTQIFTVTGDQLNPLLDVTFDGRRILNQDIVSPTPVVVIELRDENQLIPIVDTSAIVVNLRKTNAQGVFSGVPTRLSYFSGALEFVPGTAQNNRARVFYKPARLEDGLYQLEVDGFDASQNRAAQGAYKQQFRVVNESTMGNVLNYPNPFSTSTRFVYTLTGSEMPEVFQVHIYTVSGILVKVIDLKALGEVRAGQNILTDYAWDGTDEYGDRLANGVYLYRVLLRMPADITLARAQDGSQSTDRFFKGGWGKMYILR